MLDTGGNPSNADHREGQQKAAVGEQKERISHRHNILKAI